MEFPVFQMGHLTIIIDLRTFNDPFSDKGNRIHSPSALFAFQPPNRLLVNSSE
jgi:hypothetical protein